MSDQYNIWVIIIGLAVGSFSLRFVFLGLVGDRPLPEWLNRHLRYTAVAILPAIVAPLVIWPSATEGQTDPARLLAAITTIVVGLWTKNLFAAIGAGAAMLYLGLYLL